MKNNFVLCFFTITIAITQIISMDCYGESNHEESKRRLDTVVKERLRKVDIYGKIVDQNGNPVPGAKVEIGWFTFIWPLGDVSKSEFINTDNLGQWNFSTNATKIRIRNVTKDNYLFDRTELVVNNGFSGDDLYNNKTSYNNRIIFKMHKMNQPTFVMHEFMSGSNNCLDFIFGDETIYYYDIVRNRKIEKI
jgi:hypothetical protein